LSRVKKSILLVEDEAIIAMNEKLQLEQCGYQVRTVSTGEKAVEAVKASSDIDLILMDINLGGGMDGTQAAGIILKDRDIPVVFLSSHTEPEIVEKTEKITSYGYVVKNSSITVLDASIKMAFRLFDAKLKEQEKEESLRRSEEKYRTLFNVMLDGFALHEIICDSSGAPVDYRFLDVNPVFERMTGLKAADIVGRTVLEVLPGTEKHWIETYGKVALSGEPIVFENYSSTIGKHFSVRAVCPAANQFACVFEDITERKRVEKELNLQKQYLETILETTPDGFWVISPDKKISDVNAAYCRMSGYSRDELTRMKINDLDAIENPRETAERVRRILENGSETFETQHRRKDGTLIDVEVSASFFDRADGMCLVCFCRDITQRRKTQRELEESRNRYRNLVEKSPDIIYVFGTKSGGLFWSEATRRILGYEPHNVVRDPYLWDRSIHPEDKPIVEAAIAEAIHGEPFKIEYRIQSRDGSWVWLRDTLIDRTEKDGEIIIQGHAEDITESRHWEDSYKNERRRLSAIIDGTHVGTWEWNAQTGETVFNERWAEMIGYTLDEISPVSIKTWQRFVHEQDLQRSEQELRAHFNGNTGMYEAEIRMRHKDGHWVWVLDRGKVATWTEDGKPEWVFGTHQDISARKKQEEKHLALAKAASILQTVSSDTIDYEDIAETAKYLSGATFAAFNLFSANRQTFITQAIAGLSQHIQRAGKLLGFPVVGRAWDYDPDRESALGTRRTTVFPTLGSLASGNFPASTADKIARVFHVGEVVIVRIATDSEIQGDFTLLFSEGEHLEDKDLTEMYSSMVGITLKRIQTEQYNMKLVAEKETLLKEVHHRIKNNMNTVSSLLSLHANTVENPAALGAIRDAKSRVRSMQTLYDQLTLADSHNGISLFSYLKTLVPQVVHLFPRGREVVVSVTSRDSSLCVMNAKRLSTVGMIVNELVTNAMKYAFPAPAHPDERGIDAPEISVRLDCPDGEISVTVEDNGVGLPDSFDWKSTSGFGMMMVNAMAGQLEGTLQLESVHSGNTREKRGTRAVLRFPCGEPG
jgi:PAS domain S-box-containing protein